MSEPFPYMRAIVHDDEVHRRITVLQGILKRSLTPLEETTVWQNFDSELEAAGFKGYSGG